MRKTLLISFLVGMSLNMHAQTSEPVITLTYTADGTEHTLSFGSAVAKENKVTIDWGDGKIVEGATLTGIYDDYNVQGTDVTGTPTGTGVVKIYATEPLNDFECTSNMNGTGVTSLDVSKATELISLSANGNKLTTVDLSKNTKLTDVELNNNLLTTVVLPASLIKLNLQNNQLTSFDGTALTALTTLYLSNNPIATVDLSKNTALKSLYALNCGLESIILGNNTSEKTYISLNNNKLTTLDVSGCTGLSTGRLFVMNNNLSELKYTSIGTANLSGNKFTLVSLPTDNIKTLTYAPQQAMSIEANYTGTVDLSSQASVGDNSTTYTWYKKDGTALTAGTDYTEEAGKFTFTVAPSDSVYCVMSNASLPKFTGANAFKTTLTLISVPTAINTISAKHKDVHSVYTLDGRRMQGSLQEQPKGAYIVREAGKTVKVVK